MGFRCSWCLIEIKSQKRGTKKAELRPSQRAFMETCRYKCLPVYVFYGLDDAQEFVDVEAVMYP